MSYHRCISDSLRRVRERYRRARSKWFGTSQLDESGGTLVEFTVLAPLFFLIVFGIIEWGSIFYLQNSMINAAREAARSMAVQGLTTGQAQTIAANYLSGTGQTFNYTIVDLCTLSPPNKAQDISVQITTDAAEASIFNYLGMFTGVNLTSRVVMRKELACPP